MLKSFILALFLFTAFAASVSGLSCPSGQPYQCTSVSDSINYVSCINNVCVCTPTGNFDGVATTTDKCRCMSPRGIIWDRDNDNVNKAFCELPPHLEVAKAIALKQQDANCAFYENSINQLYINNIGDAGNLVLFGYVDLSPYLADNLTIRVNDVSVFNTRQLTEEYFFGLLGSQGTRMVQAVCQNNVVMTREIITFSLNYVPPNGRMNYSLTQMGEWYFRSWDRKMQLANLVINDVGDENYPIRTQNDQVVQLCSLIPYICPKSAFADRPQLAASLYDDFSDCYNFMSNIAFGIWTGETGDYLQGNSPQGVHRGASSNTTLCRVVHLKLAYIRPQVHCQHVAKVNTVKCEDHDAADHYTGEFAKQLDAEAAKNYPATAPHRL